MLELIIQEGCGLICVLQLSSQLISCTRLCAAWKLKDKLFDEVLQPFLTAG